MNEPQVSVGILSATQVCFEFFEAYIHDGLTCVGVQTVSCSSGLIHWNGGIYKELLFQPVELEQASFRLCDVVIGIHFHWERKEDQCFGGALKLIVEAGRITAINLIAVESYLVSVISSEMSATASPELLKAHAVISRSWLLAQIGKTNKRVTSSNHSAFINTKEELVRWYDREDHAHFDVCADDHCQRYQGVTRASTLAVCEAVACTRGQILMSEGQICDARFSKCCGGAVEEFRYCWEDVDHPYLKAMRDSKVCTELPDLQQEALAEKWICSSPASFCNTNDKKVLAQVLNNYDQETVDFYRWQVIYTQEELSALVLQRSGVDYGRVLDLIPLERGRSGRLVKLKIVGTLCSRIIGKELEIRRTLSSSHLYSSAFVINKELAQNGLPCRFMLTGAGWGHGVGLCQIGAAVMGNQGFSYDEILLHYYPGATINKHYE